MIDEVEGMDIDHILTKDEYHDFLRDESDVLELTKELREERRKFLSNKDEKDT